MDEFIKNYIESKKIDKEGIPEPFRYLNCVLLWELDRMNNPKEKLIVICILCSSLLCAETKNFDDTWTLYKEIGDFLKYLDREARK